MCSCPRRWHSCKRVYQGSNHSSWHQMHRSCRDQCSTTSWGTNQPGRSEASQLEELWSNQSKLSGLGQATTCNFHQSLQDSR